MSAPSAEVQGIRRFSSKKAAVGDAAGVKRAHRTTASSDTTRGLFRSSVPEEPAASAADHPAECPSSTRSSSAPAPDPRSFSSSSARQNFRTPDTINISVTSAAGGLQPRAGTAARAESDGDTLPSARSAHSLQSGSTVAPGGSTAPTEKKLHHEGWLAKRSAGKVARWQRRYFTLDGCILRYQKRPGDFARRSFDVRRAKCIAAAEQPRELQLDFGFRTWRLSADSPEAAKRWLLLLEAGRLVAGPEGALSEGPAQEAWSDEDELCSLSSTGTSAASTSSSTAPTGTATRPPRTRGLNWAPAVADWLEVDPAELDLRFAAWLPVAGGSAGRMDGKCLCKGLEKALGALWAALGAPAARRGRCDQGNAEAALADLAGCPLPEPEVLGHGIEGLLGEYLMRMLQSLRRWVEQEDPAAKELAEPLRWLIFEARPSLERFEGGASDLAGRQLGSWRVPADEMEGLLLHEWESRSCEEAARQSEALQQQPLGYTRASLELKILQKALQETRDWESNDRAADRAASLPIAALNAVLRGYRASVRALQQAPAPPRTHGGGRRSRNLSGIGSRLRDASSQGAKDLRRLGHRLMAKKPDRDAMTAVPVTQAAVASAAGQAIIASAAGEAARVAEFCIAAAKERHVSRAKGSMLADVLEAFGNAFERESAELCTVLAESHFAPAQKPLLKGACLQPHATAGSAMTALCGAAEAFLSDALAGAPALCCALAGEALVGLLVRHWIRQFRVAPPKLSANPGLAGLIAADEAALRGFAAKCGAAVRWVGTAADPLQPLREVRSILAAPSKELQAMCTVRLEVLLGVEKGRALANAACLAALR